MFGAITALFDMWVTAPVAEGIKRLGISAGRRAVGGAKNFWQSMVSTEPISNAKPTRGPAGWIGRKLSNAGRRIGESLFSLDPMGTPAVGSQNSMGSVIGLFKSVWSGLTEDLPLFYEAPNSAYINFERMRRAGLQPRGKWFNAYRPHPTILTFNEPLRRKMFIGAGIIGGIGVVGSTLKYRDPLVETIDMSRGPAKALLGEEVDGDYALGAYYNSK